MKITRISLYRKTLNYARGSYAWGRGNVISAAESSIVTVDTDAGISGCGEFCPCGENYMVAHSQGTEAAMRLIAPRLLGEDPRQVACIESLADNIIRGHGFLDLVCNAHGSAICLSVSTPPTDLASGLEFLSPRYSSCLLISRQARRKLGQGALVVSAKACSSPWLPSILPFRAA